LGSWQGRTYEEIEAECPQVHAAEIPPHGGETVVDVATRLRPWLTQLIAESTTNETVAVVAHGVIVQVCLCLGNGVNVQDYRQFVVENVSVTELII